MKTAVFSSYLIKETRTTKEIDKTYNLQIARFLFIVKEANS